MKGWIPQDHAEDNGTNRQAARGEGRGVQTDRQTGWWKRKCVTLNVFFDFYQNSLFSSMFLQIVDLADGIMVARGDLGKLVIK